MAVEINIFKKKRKRMPVKEGRLNIQPAFILRTYFQIFVENIHRLITL